MEEEPYIEEESDGRNFPLSPRSTLSFIWGGNEPTYGALFEVQARNINSEDFPRHRVHNC
jgi:hypothetical protein